jgi:hypothetical protein
VFILTQLKALLNTILSLSERNQQRQAQLFVVLETASKRASKTA